MTDRAAKLGRRRSRPARPPGSEPCCPLFQPDCQVRANPGVTVVGAAEAERHAPITVPSRAQSALASANHCSCPANSLFVRIVFIRPHAPHRINGVLPSPDDPIRRGSRRSWGIEHESLDRTTVISARLDIAIADVGAMDGVARFQRRPGHFDDSREKRPTDVSRHAARCCPGPAQPVRTDAGLSRRLSKRLPRRSSLRLNRVMSGAVQLPRVANEQVPASSGAATKRVPRDKSCLPATRCRSSDFCFHFEPYKTSRPPLVSGSLRPTGESRSSTTSSSSTG